MNCKLSTTLFLVAVIASHLPYLQSFCTREKHNSEGCDLCCRRYSQEMVNKPSNPLEDSACKCRDSICRLYIVNKSECQSCCKDRGFRSYDFGSEKYHCRCSQDPPKSIITDLMTGLGKLGSKGKNVVN